MNRVNRSLCAFGLGLVVAGCPGGDVGIVNPKLSVISVSLSPDTVFMRPGDTEQLTANVVVESGASDAVDLSSSNSQVATIDANRRVTAVSNGQAYIRATSRADATKKDSSLIIVDPCQDIAPLPIGTTVSGTVSATSCEGVKETFSLTVGAVSILSVALEPTFPATFVYFGDRSTAGWSAQISTPARTSRPLILAAGKYRVRVDALSSAQRGSFTLSANATSSLSSACLVGMTTGVRFTGATLNTCDFTPQQRPAGAYRSLRFLLLPWLAANATATITITANGFVPLVESWLETSSGPTTRTQSIPPADGTSLVLSMTGPAGGGLPTLIVSTRDAGVTGTFTIEVQGPAAGQPIQLDASRQAPWHQFAEPMREARAPAESR